jgi:DNA polymerase-3 subunit alpha
MIDIMRDKSYVSYALTDINTTSGCLDFLRVAPGKGVHPVVGIDFRDGIDQRYVGIARNNVGFKELNEFLSEQLLSDEDFPEDAPALKNTFFIYPYNRKPNRLLREYEYVGIRLSDLNKITFDHTMPPENKWVSIQSATFRNKNDHNAHILLRAIDLNILYTKLQPGDMATDEGVILNKKKLIRAFDKYPFILHNTCKLLESCHVTFDFEKPSIKNLKTFTGSEKKDQKLIRRLCRDNLKYRYPNPSDKVIQRVKKELNIIEEKGFLSYFLINWDITTYARQKGYFYVGRGSGANSIVAYLLKITDVDPIELDLYFERFINLFRENPPDFDIDFSWKDREDITQYIFDRFPHTALLATYNTFKYRAAVRELGKVFGLPKEEIDILSTGRMNTNNLDQLSRLVLKYSALIQGLPNHLSVHASGIVISQECMHNYTATFVPPKGFPTTQFDMVVAEDVGLYKFDILGQRGLAKIKDGLALVRYNNPSHDMIDIHDLRTIKNDEKVNGLLRVGKAIGCFYVESPAMRMLLKKLEVDEYLGLVAASSIIRPGVAKSGMMREYILRYRDPERRKQAHPALQKIMPDTYGIMVYQEDVIKVAHYFAQLDLGEADVLRRGMSGKYRSREEFLRIKDKYFSNCKEIGHEDELAREVWRQIESFAGYAFAKGHSASYAVESYQSLFLKAYYPIEFMVAVINNGGGFYRTELYVHEARMCGAQIKPPCINQSDYGCVVKGKKIYLGLGFVHGLESTTAKNIVDSRWRNGPFKTLLDFTERVYIGIEELTSLIRIGAFSFCEKNKKELLWRAHQLLNKPISNIEQAKLFDTVVKEYKLPHLTTEEYEDAFDQLELLGFPLCNPFLLTDQALTNAICTKDLPQYLNQTIDMMGYLIATKDTSTSKGKRMYFGTFLDQEGHFIDTVHFPLVAKRYPFTGRGVYKITGKVVEEFGFYSIEVVSLEKLTYMPDPRFGEVGYMALGKKHFGNRRRKSLKPNRRA